MKLFKVSPFFVGLFDKGKVILFFWNISSRLSLFLFLCFLFSYLFHESPFVLLLFLLLFIVLLILLYDAARHRLQELLSSLNSSLLRHGYLLLEIFPKFKSGFFTLLLYIIDILLKWALCQNFFMNLLPLEFLLELVFSNFFDIVFINLSNFLLVSLFLFLIAGILIKSPGSVAIVVLLFWLTLPDNLLISRQLSVEAIVTKQGFAIVIT